MMRKRLNCERGSFDHGWLKTHHSFSFADYHDESHMGFRTLRVINEDYIDPARGFGTHPHRDMEIITYVISGALEHKDSMGNGSQILAGDVQYMSAGRLVTHSEANPSKTESVHLLQIWILPQQKGLVPCYGQKHFSKDSKLNCLRLMISPDGRAESIQIRQNVNLYSSVLEESKRVSLELGQGRYAWVQLISGKLQVKGAGNLGESLSVGDGLAINDETILEFESQAPESEFLVFDLN